MTTPGSTGPIRRQRGPRFWCDDPQCTWNDAVLPVYKGTKSRCDPRGRARDGDAMGRPRTAAQPRHGASAKAGTQERSRWRCSGATERARALQDADPARSSRRSRGLIRGRGERFPTVERVTTKAREHAGERGPRTRTPARRRPRRVHLGSSPGRQVLMAVARAAAARTSSRPAQGAAGRPELCVYRMPGLASARRRRARAGSPA